MGVLSGDDIPAHFGRMAWPANRLAGSQRTELLNYHLGHSRRIEEFVAAMRLALAGVNHRTAPVHVREKLAFRMEDVPAALLHMQARGAKEALILSTCNRVEVTAALADDIS